MIKMEKLVQVAKLETAAAKLWKQLSDKEKLAYIKANPHSKIPADSDRINIPDRKGHLGWKDDDVEHKR